MKLLIAGALAAIIISTLSLAQIRYAIFNPLHSLDTLVAITLEIAVIIYVGYHYLGGKEKNINFGNYSLVGNKGGRSRRRRSNLNHNRKN